MKRTYWCLLTHGRGRWTYARESRLYSILVNLLTLDMTTADALAIDMRGGEFVAKVEDDAISTARPLLYKWAGMKLQILAVSNETPAP